MGGPEFNTLVVEVIQATVKNLLGAQLGAALNSFLDPSIAVKEPNGYSSRLGSVSGASGTLIRKIELELCERVGIEDKAWRTFKECVDAAKAHAQASPP